MLLRAGSYVAILFAAVSFVCVGDLKAQSLSDLDWDGFEAQTSEKTTRSHIDPFAGGSTSAEDLAVEELQLSGIVYRDENDAYALISGYLVRPGDRIAGYRVDLIEKDKVRLKRVDDVFILSLGGGI